MSLTTMPLRELLRLLLCAVCVLPLSVVGAAQDFSSNLHQSTTTPNPKFDEANAALDAHDYEKALKLLAPLAAADPKDARILYDLAAAQDALDQTSPAEASYRAAIADDPAYLDPGVALGLMLARSGRMDDARTEFLAATKLPAGDPQLKARAYRALARIDEKSRPADARDELLEALKLTSETPEDTLLGAELAESASNGAAAAEAAYRRVLARTPNDPAATSELAHLLAKQLRADEAEDLLATALKAHPGDPALTVQLATLYAGQNKTDLALPLVQRLHLASPSDSNVGRLLANLYLETQDYANAEPLLATLSLQNPRDATLVDDRGRALIHLKRFAEAQQILTRVVAQPTLFPTAADFGNAAGDLAFAASSNNDPIAALQALQVRGTVLPTSAPVLFLTAISHDKLHHAKLAIEAYKQFLEASKDTNPDEEFEARHRIVALAPMK
jgi:tetratricopeptide (TPR) repeat protein